MIFDAFFGRMNQNEYGFENITSILNIIRIYIYVFLIKNQNCGARTGQHGDVKKCSPLQLAALINLETPNKPGTKKDSFFLSHNIHQICKRNTQNH